MKKWREGAALITEEEGGRVDKWRARVGGFMDGKERSGRALKQRRKVRERSTEKVHLLRQKSSTIEQKACQMVSPFPLVLVCPFADCTDFILFPIEPLNAHTLLDLLFPTRPYLRRSLRFGSWDISKQLTINL